MMLALPVAPTDVAQGVSLAKLWADLEPSYNKDVIVALVCRFDMDPATTFSPQLIFDLSQKFKVITHRVTHQGTGWPAGCNALEVGLYEWFVESNRSGKFDIEYLFICEADTVPLRPTWIAEILSEAKETRAKMLGAYFTAEEGCQHINGNAVIHRDMWKYCKSIWLVPHNKGWDAYIGKETTAFGTPSKLIWQDYRLGAPEKPWVSDDFLFEDKSYPGPNNPLHGQKLRPAMFHGVKTTQGISAVRKKYSI